MSENTLSLWVVTANPKDFPGKFVARENIIGPGGHHSLSKECLVGNSLEALRAILRRKSLHRMERWADDDPVIVEVWL